MGAPCWTTTSNNVNKGDNDGCDQESRLRSRLWWAAMVLLFAAYAPVVVGLVEKECQLDSFRLPRRVQPTNYRLLIRPNLDTWSYSAELTIELLVHQEESEADPAGALCGLTSRRVENPLKRRKKKSRYGSGRQLSPACDHSKLILHAHPQLNISQIDFITSDPSSENQLVQVRNLCRDLKNEFLVVSLGQELEHRTTGKLRLHFTGPIRDDMHGFFRSKHYRDPKSGHQRYMAVTHFQAPHARKTFPCFDEPNFKSNFNLVIEHASHLRALSNMHVIKEENILRRRRRRRLLSTSRGATEMIANEDDENGDENEEEADDEEEVSEQMTRVTFAQTPRMSTYLLAFALGHFDHIETRVGDLRLAIWTPPNRAHLATYALRNAARAYASLRNYFTIEQPLEKIDFLAVGELDAGAMENWGLITFTERFLLLDEHLTTPDDINYAADSITHELSHQWFGNLVTMKWWDDLWLNEGFATWITQVINQQLYPDRDGELIYLADALNAALNSDASRNTHPIRNKRLETAKEIEGAFDDITYEKASAVIRMLNDYIGPASFKRGIQNYLANNLYQSTEALDLWAALETNSSLGVRDFMTSWIDQPGFPLIRARLTQDGRSLRIDQERFLERPLPINNQATNANNTDQMSPATSTTTTRRPPTVDNDLRFKRQKWAIPVAMWISNGNRRIKLFKVILSERGANIKLPWWFEPGKPGHWLKLNARFAGFYRVRYEDARLFQALRWPIERKILEPSDRLNLICDSFALLANEKLDMYQFDDALSWFRGEDNDAVLELLARYIASLEAHQYPSSWNRTKLLLDYHQREGHFNLNPANSWLKLRTRATVASTLIGLQNEQVTRDALNQFVRLGNGLHVTPSFRVPIYSAVARAGTPQQIERLVALIQQIESSHSSARLVEAMTESMGANGAARQPS